MNPVFTRQERRYFALLRERDELRYQIEMYNGWIAEKQRRIGHIDGEIAKLESKGSDTIVNTSEKTTVSYEALSEVCGAGEK